MIAFVFKLISQNPHSRALPDNISLFRRAYALFLLTVHNAKTRGYVPPAAIDASEADGYDDEVVLVPNPRPAHDSEVIGRRLYKVEELHKSSGCVISLIRLRFVVLNSPGSQSRHSRCVSPPRSKSRRRAPSPGPDDPREWRLGRCCSDLYITPYRSLS